MDDYCVNCKTFRNMNNKMEKVSINGWNFSIDDGYGVDPMDYSEYAIYHYVEAFRCEFCRSVQFKDDYIEDGN